MAAISTAHMWDMILTSLGDSKTLTSALLRDAAHAFEIRTSIENLGNAQAAGEDSSSPFVDRTPDYKQPVRNQLQERSVGRIVQAVS